MVNIVGPPNYTGLRCEQGMLFITEYPVTQFSSYTLEIDFCLSNPCKNNGRCLSGKTGYRCHCYDGYMGDRCDGNTHTYINTLLYQVVSFS